MYVCMYVFLLRCMYVCMYVCKYVCMVLTAMQHAMQQTDEFFKESEELLLRCNVTCCPIPMLSVQQCVNSVATDPAVLARYAKAFARAVGA